MLSEQSIFYEKVDSTQDVAYKLALRGEPEGTTVITDYQTAGRGRLGRKWFASPGKSILCSLILRPNISPEQTFLLTRLIAYVIKQVIEKKTDLSVYFKHPNDLLISGKKIAGVLAETRVKGEKLEFVILGIGINANVKKEQLIEGATSLRQESGKSFSRPALLKKILRKFWGKYFEKGV